jgi:hypothetical protein
VIEFAGHHATPGSQRGHVPALLPEDTHRREAVRTQARAIFERQQPDERRLAGAIGAENGRVLWEHELDAALEGIPAVYELGGRQYVVFCAAAQVGLTPATQVKIPGAYVAFALPKAESAAGQR